MAILENLITGEKIFLKPHHMFGRNAEKSDTVLQYTGISQIHASICWNGEEWTLTDLSRNGILIDNVRAISGKKIRIRQGNEIRFSIVEESLWIMTDENPPRNVIVSLEEHNSFIELNRFHILPDEVTPDISVYISHTGRWVYENADGTFPLNNGDIISHTQRAWVFCCADSIEATLPLHNMEDCCFNFCVSNDEEHVRAKIKLRKETINLGERVHHYMLLVLARQRLKDAKDGDDLETQGWIEFELLADMLRLDKNHLNIQIFRARKQVNAVLPELLTIPQVVERRVGSLRFGFTNFQIQRGSAFEGALYRGIFK